LFPPERSPIKFYFFAKKGLIQSLGITLQFPGNSQTIYLDSYRQHTSSHGKGNPGQIGRFPIESHVAATLPGYCIIRLFFGWLKTQLERRGYNWEDELYEAADEILTSLSSEMIEIVCGD
jgi:hypothetical protein